MPKMPNKVYLFIYLFITFLTFFQLVTSGVSYYSHSAVAQMVLTSLVSFNIFIINLVFCKGVTILQTIDIS